jgi:hypothetical protein
MNLPTMILIACILSLYGPVNLVADSGSNSGTVAEIIDAGGYTYLRIEESDTWIATSTMEVSQGTQVEYSGGSEMLNFHSKSLDRTFESIWFVGNVSISGQDTEQLQQGAGSHPSAHDTIPRSTAIASPAAGEIEKLEGGRTIEEILSDPAALNTQAVSLRARVTKVNANIMGRNWITLQDGTGIAPGNKLIATSQEMVTVGEIVTAKGVISNDVDLGSGYHYAALLEDATFAK